MHAPPARAILTLRRAYSAICAIQPGGGTRQLSLTVTATVCV